MSGPEILEIDIEQAVKQSKVGKATGPDNISCEMLKALGKDGVGVLCKLFNQICNQGGTGRKDVPVSFCTITQEARKISM